MMMFMRGLTGPRAAWSGQSCSRDDAQVGDAAWRRWAFGRIAEADGTQAGHELLHVDQRGVAVGDPAASGDQSLERPGEMLQRIMPGRRGDPGGGAGADHAHLQFGDFLERGFDDVLDGANLRGDFEGSGFNHNLAHDSSFPATRGSPAWRLGPVNLLKSISSC